MSEEKTLGQIAYEAAAEYNGDVRSWADANKGTWEVAAGAVAASCSLLTKLLNSRTDKLPVPLPDFDKPVLAVLRHCSSGNQIYGVLKAVDGGDHNWETCDDGSELSFAWDVISWQYLPALH